MPRSPWLHNFGLGVLLAAAFAAGTLAAEWTTAYIVRWRIEERAGEHEPATDAPQATWSSPPPHRATHA